MQSFTYKDVIILPLTLQLTSVTSHTAKINLYTKFETLIITLLPVRRTFYLSHIHYLREVKSVFSLDEFQ